MPTQGRKRRVLGLRHVGRKSGKAYRSVAIKIDRMSSFRPQPTY